MPCIKVSAKCKQWSYAQRTRYQWMCARKKAERERERKRNIFSSCCPTIMFSACKSLLQHNFCILCKERHKCHHVPVLTFVFFYRIECMQMSISQFLIIIFPFYINLNGNQMHSVKIYYILWIIQRIALSINLIAIYSHIYFYIL